MNRTLYIFAVLSLILSVACGCQAAGSLFDADEAGRTAAGAIAQDAANATGNPLIIGIVGAVNAAISGIILAVARKGAKQAVEAKDKEEWTEADAEAMAAKMRALGFKVERAS